MSTLLLQFYGTLELKKIYISSCLPLKGTFILPSSFLLLVLPFWSTGVLRALGGPSTVVRRILEFILFPAPCIPSVSKPSGLYPQRTLWIHPFLFIPFAPALVEIPFIYRLDSGNNRHCSVCLQGLLFPSSLALHRITPNFLAVI